MCAISDELASFAAWSLVAALEGIRTQTEHPPPLPRPPLAAEAQLTTTKAEEAAAAAAAAQQILTDGECACVRVRVCVF